MLGVTVPTKNPPQRRAIRRIILGLLGIVVVSERKDYVLGKSRMNSSNS